MAVKIFLFLVAVLFLNLVPGWCEPAVHEKELSHADSQQDPYGNITWSSVLADKKHQKDEWVVVGQRTRKGKVYSVSSTGTATNAQSAVVITKSKTA